MQRLDYHVLVPYLQPKLEYVISINMTDLQSRLYKFYLENYAKAGQVGLDGKLEGGKKGGLFYDVQNLSRIWNHPYILHLSKLRKMDKVIKTLFSINFKVVEESRFAAFYFLKIKLITSVFVNSLKKIHS